MSEKSIATLEIIDEITGEATPVNVRTCAEAVVCKDDMPLAEHLAALDAHANDKAAHLTAEEKAALETTTGAQEKATAAKNEAIAASSLEINTAKIAAAQDATAKANAARDAAYKYADSVGGSLENHKADNSNPHKVTAAQVGLGNVVNKAPNDLQPTYTAASALTALSSGEKLSVAFGKIAKAITDLIAHLANKSNPHGVTFKQAGAIQMNTLWYNSAATSSFPAQTISLDLSVYDYVLIIPSFSAKKTRRCPVFMCQVGSSSPGFLNVHNASDGIIAHRMVSNITTSGITFESAAVMTGFNTDGTYNDYYCIPLQIIGIRGVL